LLDTRLVGFYPTLDPPMRGIVDDLKAAETAPILSASIGHGFPWADVADVGTRVLVYADRDEAAATAAAERFAARLYAERHTLLPAYPSVSESLDRVRELNGSVVLGDVADNPGCGAPGDSTFFLKAMIDRGVTDAVIGAFWDPFVAQVCAEAGVGSCLIIRLGGKCGASSGDPIDLPVEVMGVVEDHTTMVFGGRQRMGRSVWLRTGGVDIAVCSVRTQVFDPDAFTGLGISLDDKRLIVVKSSNHYQAWVPAQGRPSVARRFTGGGGARFRPHALYQARSRLFPSHRRSLGSARPAKGGTVPPRRGDGGLKTFLGLGPALPFNGVAIVIGTP